MDTIDFSDPAQAQNYILALRSFVTELNCLKNDMVNGVMVKYNIHNVYSPSDKINFRLNIDWPTDQEIVESPVAVASAIGNG
jgi:hypothetical protein